MAKQKASKSRHTQTGQPGDHDKDQQLQGLLSQSRAVLWNQQARGSGRTRSSCHLFEAPAWSVRGHACPQGSIKLKYSVASLLRLYLLLYASENSSWGQRLFCSLPLGVLKPETKWGILPDNSLSNLWKKAEEKGLLKLLTHMEKTVYNYALSVAPKTDGGTKIYQQTRLQSATTTYPACTN